jgi:hypothetical protein
VQDAAFLEFVQLEGVTHGEFLFGEDVVEMGEVALVLFCELEFGSHGFLVGDLDCSKVLLQFQVTLI